MSASVKSNGLNIVICGGGIIGVCTAYYLSQRKNVSSITIIERYQIAGCASGKAGGFLACNWCDDDPRKPLTRKSFQLHTELGQQYGKKYQYRPTIAYEVKSEYAKRRNKQQRSQKRKHASDGTWDFPQWFDSKIIKEAIIGTSSYRTTAQVHPRLFCETLCDLMKSKLRIKYGIVSEIIFDKNDSAKVIGVGFVPNDRKSNKCVQILCDSVVIAMGPWSNQSFEWFPKCKSSKYITGTKANSIVITPDYTQNKNDNEEKKQQCVESLDGQLFLMHKNADGKWLDIEVYTRPDGTVYSCFEAKQRKLPNDPSKVVQDEGDSELIFEGLKELSRYTLNSKLMIKQACYYPCSSAEDDIPLIGQITGYKNAFIGTGHTVWGILNGPATGLLLTELIVDGKVTSIKQDEFERFDPSRK